MPDFIRHIGRLLVRSCEIVPVRDKEHALELLRERPSFEGSRPHTQELERLACDLFEGRVFLVKTRGRVPLDAPTVVPLTSLGELLDDDLIPLKPEILGDDPISHGPKPDDLTFLAVRVVDEDGVVIPGLALDVELPSGQSEVAKTDGNGNFRIEHISVPGLASLTLTGPIDLPQNAPAG